MKNIGFIGAIFLAMILTAVATRRCGNVYTDTYPTAAAQRDAVERGDTVKSGLYKDGSVALSDSTRPMEIGVCGSRVNGGDWPVGVVGAIVCAGWVFFMRRKTAAANAKEDVEYTNR